MPALTTTYEFNKPTAGGDTSVWGGLLNDNWDDIDALLTGTSEVSRIAFDGGTVALPAITFFGDLNTGFYSPTGDQIGMTTGGTRRALLSSAAYQIDVQITGTAVQTNSTDTTAGRLMAVGAFGLGNNGSSSTAAIADLNSTSLAIGFYTANASTLNKPAGATTFGFVVVLRLASASLHQTYYNSDGSAAFTRVYSGGAWTSWLQLLDSGDVQSNSTDTTAGRLMAVGAFGLGELGAPFTPPSDATPAETGFVSSTSGFLSATGLPVTGAGITMRWSATRAVQLFGSVSAGNDGRLFSRHQVADNTWGTFQEIFGQKNILGTVSQSGGVPTGRLIERGSNANGEYVRFADGTQICTLTKAGLAGGAETWTFPAAFAAAPQHIGAGASSSSPRFVTIDSLSSTVAGFSVYDASGSRTAQSARLSAIGRWF